MRPTVWCAPLATSNASRVFGVDPVRIDILTSVSGLEFQAAWSQRQILELDGLQVPVVSLDDLIANKRATGRPQDLLDIQWIEDSQK